MCHQICGSAGGDLWPAWVRQAWAAGLNAQAPRTMVHCPAELSFTSAKPYGNPFQDVDLDVIVRDPDGLELQVPAYWAGALTWRARYSPAKPGRTRGARFPPTPQMQAFTRAEAHSRRFVIVARIRCTGMDRYA